MIDQIFIYLMLVICTAFITWLICHEAANYKKLRIAEANKKAEEISKQRHMIETLWNDKYFIEKRLVEIEKKLAECCKGKK